MKYCYIFIEIFIEIVLHVEGLASSDFLDVIENRNSIMVSILNIETF